MVELFTVTVSLPFFPFFVVIIIAPLRPTDPYNADAVAPFKTLMLSISSELTFHKSVVRSGIPSITNNGLAPRLK